MKEFTKDNLKQLRDDINAALADVAKKHNIILTPGNASFNPNEVNFKLHGVIKSEGVSNESDALAAKFAKDFTSFANLFGMNKEDLGKSFTSKGKTFTVVGLDRKKHKLPVVVRDSTGKDYKASVEHVNSALGR